MVVAVSLLLFSGCAGIKPTVSISLGSSKLHQADTRGPHEASIRAGEERVLLWTPELKTGNYTVRTSLAYDRNRHNELAFTEDQTTLSSISLAVKVE